MHPLRPFVLPYALLPGLAAALAACDGSASGPGARLALSLADTTLEVGESAQLSARGFSAEPVWSSSDTTVARVLSTGYVTATGPGTAQVTAVSGGRSASAAVHVLPVPALALSLSKAAFSAITGGGDAPPQRVEVAGTRTSVLGALAAPVQYPERGPRDWLSVTLSAPTAPATLVLQPQTGTLPAGTYTAAVHVAAARADTVTVAVTLTVGPAPVVNVSPASASFTATLGAADPDPQLLEVANGSATPLTELGGTVGYGAGEPTGWLTAVLGSRAAPTSLELRVRTAGLPAGAYTAWVDLGASQPGAAPRRVPVVLAVTPGPSVRLDAHTVTFGADPAPRTVAVHNGGGGTLGGLSVSVAGKDGGPVAWLTAGLSTPSAPSTLILRARTAGLAEGDYEAWVTVGSSVPGVPAATLLVTLTLRATPVVLVSPADVEPVAQEGGGDPAPDTVQVSNGGGGTLSGVSAQTTYGPGAAGWLDVAYGGGGPGPAVLRARTGSLGAGTYTAAVTFSSSVPGVPAATVNVVFTVRPVPVIHLSPESAHFASSVGGTDPQPQTITVTDTAGAALTGLTREVRYAPGEPGEWLAAELSRTNGIWSLTLRAGTGDLPAGTFHAEVAVRSAMPGVAERRMAVTFVVDRAAEVVIERDARVSFPRAPPGNEESIGVGHGEGPPVTGLTSATRYSSGPRGWLTASLDGTRTPTTLRLMVRADSLPRGVGGYVAHVVVSGGPGTIPDSVRVDYLVTVSFADDVLVAFDTVTSAWGGACTQCHADSRKAFGYLNLDPDSAYRELRFEPAAYSSDRRVTPYDLGQTREVNLLLCILAESCPERDAHDYPPQLRALIARWIHEGAPNN